MNEREIKREVLRRHRSIVLNLLQQLGIDTTDWDQVNEFCRNPKIAGRVFAELAPEDLMKLATKLRCMKRKGWSRSAPGSKVQSLTLLIGRGGDEGISYN